jgi:hypothetical protein
MALPSPQLLFDASAGVLLRERVPGPTSAGASRAGGVSAPVLEARGQARRCSPLKRRFSRRFEALHAWSPPKRREKRHSEGLHLAAAVGTAWPCTLLHGSYPSRPPYASARAWTAWPCTLLHSSYNPRPPHAPARAWTAAHHARLHSSCTSRQPCAVVDVEQTLASPAPPSAGPRPPAGARSHRSRYSAVRACSGWRSLP